MLDKSDRSSKKAGRAPDPKKGKALKIKGQARDSEKEMTRGSVKSHGRGKSGRS